MNLPTDGREYAHWTVTGLPSDPGAVEVSFDAGTSWDELTVSGTDASVLVAGPDATGNPAGTVVLAAGRNRAIIRLTDNPEVVIRAAGSIVVA